MSSLEDKLKQLAETKKAEKEIDWNARREWWLAHLDKLYAEIAEWLKPLSEKGLLTTRSYDWRITEEYIGQYTAKGLVLESNDVEILLEPKGTLIVGGFGRVDVYRSGYARAPIMLILNDRTGDREKAAWEIWPARDPRQMKRLDKESFEATIAALIP